MIPHNLIGRARAAAPPDRDLARAPPPTGVVAADGERRRAPRPASRCACKCY